MTEAGRAVVSSEPGAELEAIISGQIARWTRGDREPVEAILRRHPEFLSRQSAVLELIYQEIVLREMSGETPLSQDYLGRFADHDLSEGIARLFEVHGGFSGLDTVDFPRNDPATTGRPALGVSIPGYDVVRKLGEGGMGVVYFARHRALNRPVALKMLHLHIEADAEEHARLLREAEAIAKFQHPNLVQIHEVGEHEGRPYLALEYLDGGTLAKHLAGQPRDPREAAELVETLARAIDHAHARGVVHRDLKPANVLLTAGAIPKITDFGLAMLADSRSNRTGPGAILGTLAYMAPEQAASRRDGVGPWTDIHALGIILYEALTGRLPYRAGTPEQTLRLVIDADPTPPSVHRPGLPADMEAICLKCLEKNPRHRYACGADLGEDLRRFLEGEPVLARPIPAWTRLARKARRNPVVSTLMAACAAAIIAVVAVVAYDSVRLDRTARRASRNFQKAFEAVNRMLAQVGRDDLADIPEMEQVRRKLLDDAVRLLQELRDDDNQSDPAFLRELGRVHESTALLRALLGDRHGSIHDYREAIAIQSKLVKEFPAARKYRIDLGLSHEGLAFLHINDPTLSVSRPNYEAAIGFLEPLASGDPVQLGRLATCYNNFALAVGHIEGNTDEVVKYHEKAIAIRKDLARNDPDRYEPDLVQSEFNLALNSLVQEGPTAAVVKSLREVLATCMRLTNTADPRQKRRHLNALGECQIALATALKDAEAADLMEKAVKNRRMLVHDYPESVSCLHGLASVLHCRGVQELDQGRNVQALDLFNEAISIRERTVQLSPENLRFKAFLADTYGVRALVRARLGEQPAEVTRLFAEARGILEPLCRDYPDDPGFAKMLAQISYTYAGFAEGQGREQEVIEVLDPAIAMLERLAHVRARDLEMRRYLTKAYLARALIENNTKRYARAAPFWGSFCSWAEAKDRERFRFLACYAFARAGDHDRVCREAERDGPLDPKDGKAACDWSCVFALAAASTLNDRTIAAPRRSALAEERADRAMSFLVLARQLKFFEQPGAIEELKTEIELEALHDRTDFKEFVKSLESERENKPPPVRDATSLSHPAIP